MKEVATFLFGFSGIACILGLFLIFLIKLGKQETVRVYSPVPQCEWREYKRVGEFINFLVVCENLDSAMITTLQGK